MFHGQDTSNLRVLTIGSASCSINDDGSYHPKKQSECCGLICSVMALQPEYASDRAVHPHGVINTDQDCRAIRILEARWPNRHTKEYLLEWAEALEDGTQAEPTWESEQDVSMDLVRGWRVEQSCRRKDWKVCRQSIMDIFKSCPEIRHYTSWPVARQRLEIAQMLGVDDDMDVCEKVFAQHISELKALFKNSLDNSRSRMSAQSGPAPVAQASQGPPINHNMNCKLLGLPPELIQIILTFALPCHQEISLTDPDGTLEDALAPFLACKKLFNLAYCYILQKNTFAVNARRNNVDDTEFLLPDYLYRYADDVRCLHRYADHVRHLIITIDLDLAQEKRAVGSDTKATLCGVLLRQAFWAFSNLNHVELMLRFNTPMAEARIGVAVFLRARDLLRSILAHYDQLFGQVTRRTIALLDAHISITDHRQEPQEGDLMMGSTATGAVARVPMLTDYLLRNCGRVLALQSRRHIEPPPETSLNIELPPLLTDLGEPHWLKALYARDIARGGADKIGMATLDGLRRSLRR